MKEALAEKDMLLVRVSASLADRREARLRAALRASFAGPVDPVAVEEVILQGYLFLGYPAALRAFAIWREMSGRTAGPAQPGTWDDWSERGERVCREVYGRQYENLRQNIGGLHPDLADWMVVEGYGKVLGRPGLDLKTRELCIAALLAVLDAPAQLHSHLRGALNAGASVAEVEHALSLAQWIADEGVARRARETWHAVRGRWQSLAGGEPE